MAPGAGRGTGAPAARRGPDLYPAIKAVAEGDEITPTRTLVPRVGYPPSLAIAPREFLAVLDARDYERLIHLIDARRALQAHCRRIGKQGVWQL